MWSPNTHSKIIKAVKAKLNKEYEDKSSAKFAYMMNELCGKVDDVMEACLTEEDGLGKGLVEWGYEDAPLAFKNATRELYIKIVREIEAMFPELIIEYWENGREQLLIKTRFTSF
jgi:hypothetical protein